MTHSISTSSVPDVGSYSNEIMGVGTLWKILIFALIEWPITRTPDVLSLLAAIAEVPDIIHNGEAADEDGKPWRWSQFPYFSLYWPNHYRPGEICRRCSDEGELAAARRLYLRVKDLEAQLIANKVMGLGMGRIQDIIRALEKNIDDSDRRTATNEAAAHDQVKLDFHIPAISFLFRYDVREIYDRVVRDGHRDWTPGQLLPEVSKGFEDGAERWTFWKQRLGELTQGKEGDDVAVAARSALRSMVLCKAV